MGRGRNEFEVEGASKDARQLEVLEKGKRLRFAGFDGEAKYIYLFFHV
jgi:hypothetical protein